MEVSARINAFAKLGAQVQQFIDAYQPSDGYLEGEHAAFAQLLRSAKNYNAWFTEEQIVYALQGIAKQLQEDKLRKWLSAYNLGNKPAKRVGVVMAGNIPMVGFHDLLSVLISGNTVVAKLSSSDSKLIPHLMGMLKQIEPQFTDRIVFEERLNNIDAVIATGSNNSARYFEYYFGKYPHIIRKNRTSLAVLTGNETPEQLAALMDDIFMYFGMGCRNVSKLMVPEGYSLNKVFEATLKYEHYMNHNKFQNNYEYTKAVYLMNTIPFLDNNFLILKEDKSLHAPTAVLFYEYYADITDCLKQLENSHEQLQCVVMADSVQTSSTLRLVNMGEAQHPELWDYADGVDTMQFLSNL